MSFKKSPQKIMGLDEKPVCAVCCGPAHIYAHTGATILHCSYCLTICLTRAGFKTVLIGIPTHQLLDLCSIVSKNMMEENHHFLPPVYNRHTEIFTFSICDGEHYWKYSVRLPYLDHNEL